MEDLKQKFELLLEYNYETELEQKSKVNDLYYTFLYDMNHFVELVICIKSDLGVKVTNKDKISIAKQKILNSFEYCAYLRLVNIDKMYKQFDGDIIDPINEKYMFQMYKLLKFYHNKNNDKSKQDSTNENDNEK